MERYIGHQPDVVERLQPILRNARDIKQVIQKVGQSMAPTEAQPPAARVELRPALGGPPCARGRRRRERPQRGPRPAWSDIAASSKRPTTAARPSSWCEVSPPTSTTTRSSPTFACPICPATICLLKLKEVMPVVPMVLMTGFGYDPGHSIVKARQAGLQAVLYKPFRLDQLLETVEHLVTTSDTPQPVS